MAGSNPQMEWTFLGEEQADQPAVRMGRHAHVLPVQGERIPAPGRGGHAHWGRWLTLMAALLFVVMWARLYCEAHRDLVVLKQEVEESVERDVRLQQLSSSVWADTMLYAPMRAGLRRSLENEQAHLHEMTRGVAVDVVTNRATIRFAGSTAVADVTLVLPGASPGDTAIFRQTRFYCRVNDGWARAAPDPALWGEPQELETQHVIWRYQTRDAAAVEAVAGEIDTLYMQLRRDVGLGEAPGRGLRIDVRVDCPPRFNQVRYPVPSIPTLTLASPAVYLAPDTISEAEILSQAAGLGLVKVVQVEAIVHHGLADTQPLLNGLKLWQIWDMGLGLSTWRDAVVAWALQDAAPGLIMDADLVENYAAFCLEHHLWMANPTVFGLPLSCDEPDLFKVERPAQLPTLNELALVRPSSLPSNMSYDERREYDRELRQRSIVPLATVIDYIVTRYGRERLPVFITAAKQHGSWETLVPAVFGVTVEEFEQGWQAHLHHCLQSR